MADDSKQKLNDVSNIFEMVHVDELIFKMLKAKRQI